MKPTIKHPLFLVDLNDNYNNKTNLMISVMFLRSKILEYTRRNIPNHCYTNECSCLWMWLNNGDLTFYFYFYFIVTEPQPSYYQVQLRQSGQFVANGYPPAGQTCRMSQRGIIPTFEETISSLPYNSGGGNNRTSCTLRLQLFLSNFFILLINCLNH